MPNDLDKQIRAKIGDRILEPYPTARVFTWNVLPRDIKDWPGVFHINANLTHGWVIMRDNTSAEWKAPGRDRRLWNYHLLSFYKFRTGNKASNSDNEFAEICDTVYDSIKAYPTLDFNGTVDKHGLLQTLRNTLINAGEDALHYAHHRLQVMLCC